MVGVFEKGKADVKLTARSNGGHSAAPTKHTPVERLAAFVTDIEKHKPFRRKFLPEVSAMFKRLSPYAPFGLKLVMEISGSFGPLMKPVLGSISAQAGAMLQTTIAFYHAVGIGCLQRAATGSDPGRKLTLHSPSRHGRKPIHPAQTGGETRS